MSKAEPFYRKVVCTKVLGGKKPLWHAKKEGSHYCGAGNTADNAIKDLQAQIKSATNRPHRSDGTYSKG